MSDKILPRRLAECGDIFEPPYERLFAVLDPAREPKIWSILQTHDVKHITLYGGQLRETLEEYGPILVEFQNREEFLHELLTRGWGEAWGVFLVSACSFDMIRNALRRLLGVQMPDGGRALFRFYDPRVLRVFFPTSNDAERELFFQGVIQEYWVESSDKQTVIRFLPNGEAIRYCPLHELVDSGTASRLDR